jgi:glycosyltransferase involved in cell wall biosynthesis
VCGVKILWHSNSPNAPSGYGTQTVTNIPRIAALGHEITISAPYSFGGQPLDWSGFLLEGAVRDQAGNDILAARYRYHGADLLLTLCDPFGLIGCARDLATVHTAFWFPVDCDPLGEADVTVLRDSQAIPIAMSRFGERVLRAEGADPLYVPHSIETGRFSPGTSAPYRDTAGIEPDVFVVGINAMNRDKIRKGLTEQMMAFAKFHRNHPGTVLAMNTAAVGQPGLNLAGMGARLGITDALRFPDDYSYAAGLISTDQMIAWYRGLDILSNCSYGEGFGLPVLEAQACGIPVAVTDCSALTELCGAGWLVSGTDFWAPDSGAMWKRPDVDDIASAYEAAYEAWQLGTLPKVQAREFAMQFDADRVATLYWKPALQELEAAIGL